jgi:cytochrome c oxidase cbb3-type subunit III
MGFGRMESAKNECDILGDEIHELAGHEGMDIFKIINEGTPAESPGHNGAKMEAWGQKMPPVKVAELTAFIISRNQAEFAK